MEEIVEQIRKLIKKKASLRRVAIGLDMDRAQLVRSLKIGTRPRIDTIVKILDYLGYEIRIVKSRKMEMKRGRPERQNRNELKKGGQFR